MLIFFCSQFFTRLPSLSRSFLHEVGGLPFFFPVALATPVIMSDQLTPLPSTINLLSFGSKIGAFKPISNPQLPHKTSNQP
jgi:hypothetical protein